MERTLARQVLKAMRACARMIVASLALIMVLHGAALAQDTREEPARFFLEADELVEESGSALRVVRGNVILSNDEQTIHADELIYDTQNGRITARGNVRIYSGDEPAQLADELVLDESLEEGIAYGFATLLENNGRAAAAAAVRRPDGSIELNDAYYTACELCEDGTEAPTWRLRAKKVVRDLEDNMIYYRHARLEVLGVPSLYFPVFAHADPSAQRQSGLLLPKVDISNRLGFSYQQPYFWALSPYQDLIIAPRVMTEVAPLLELEYRKQFYSGELNIETSFTYDQEFDQDGEFGSEELRGHMFADGLFEFSERWRWGFGVQAASEDTYLRRYDYSEAPEESHGLFQYAQQRMLLNQLFLVGRGERFYFDVSTASFDRLQDGFDDDGLPYITPFVRFEMDQDLPYGLGDLDLEANLVNLRRELGDDYTRASAGLDWSRPVIVPGGVRLEGFATGRFDWYDYTETDNSGAIVEENDFSRVRGAAGIDLSYPLVRRGARFDTLLTPRMALITANGGDADERPLNEDAVSLDFDRSFMFDPVRSPGYDIFEDGTRIDAGLSLAFEDQPNDVSVTMFAGRSYRLDGGEEVFEEASGVFEDESDWIADIDVDLGGLSLGASTRLDSQTQDINRFTSYVSLDLWRINLTSSYIDISDEAATRAREELAASVSAQISPNVQAFYQGTFDLQTHEDRIQRAGLNYRDDCTALRVYWERDNIRVGNLGPSESIKFELVLFTLGGIGAD